eukprot:gene47249-28288_t
MLVPARDAVSAMYNAAPRALLAAVRANCDCKPCRRLPVTELTH